MIDLAEENDRLKWENKRLQELLGESVDQMQASADYWRNKYLAVARVLMEEWATQDR